MNRPGDWGGVEQAHPAHLPPPDMHLSAYHSTAPVVNYTACRPWHTLYGMYTMDDHRTNARKYPACSLEHVWHQRGNATGHCAKCHQTFEGITVFDAHQSTGEDGKTICKAPSEMTVGGKPLRLIDGSWRGPGMPEAEIERRRTARLSALSQEA